MTSRPALTHSHPTSEKENTVATLTGPIRGVTIEASAEAGTAVDIIRNFCSSACQELLQAEPVQHATSGSTAPCA